MYGIAMSKERPEEKERVKIIQNHLEKVDPSRLNSSERFDMDEILKHTKGMDLLELILFLHQYFEISLLANGELVSMEEYNNRWNASNSLEDEEAEEEEFIAAEAQEV